MIAFALAYDSMMVGGRLPPALASLLPAVLRGGRSKKKKQWQQCVGRSSSSLGVLPWLWWRAACLRDAAARSYYY